MWTPRKPITRNYRIPVLPVGSDIKRTTRPGTLMDPSPILVLNGQKSARVIHPLQTLGDDCAEAFPGRTIRSRRSRFSFLLIFPAYYSCRTPDPDRVRRSEGTVLVFSFFVSLILLCMIFFGPPAMLGSRLGAGMGFSPMAW